MTLQVVATTDLGPTKVTRFSERMVGLVGQNVSGKVVTEDLLFAERTKVYFSILS